MNYEFRGQDLSSAVQRTRPFVFGVVATLLSVAVIVFNILIDIDEPGLITGTALACLALALMFALPPFFHLKRHGNPGKGDAFFSTSRVVDRGAYAVVRHPQYVGYALLAFGLALLDPHWGAIVIAVGVSVFFCLQAISEERYCAIQLGPDYEHYAKRVPRFNFVLGLFRLARNRFR